MYQDGYVSSAYPCASKLPLQIFFSKMRMFVYHQGLIHWGLTPPCAQSLMAENYSFVSAISVRWFSTLAMFVSSWRSCYRFLSWTIEICEVNNSSAQPPFKSINCLSPSLAKNYLGGNCSLFRTFGIDTILLLLNTDFWNVSPCIANSEYFHYSLLIWYLCYFFE